MKHPTQTPAMRPAQDNEQASSFLVPDWAIEEYQAIQLEETGKQISKAKTIEELVKLVGFYKLVLGEDNGALKHPKRISGKKQTKNVPMTAYYYSEVAS